MTGFPPDVRYAPHEYQMKVHRSTANRKIIVAGRQSGKTVTAVNEMALWAMSAPERWPNDPEPQFWWVTGSYKTKDKAWRDLKQYLPRRVVSKVNEHELYMLLRNGSRISIRSADAPDSLVSERLHGLVGDECGQWDAVVFDGRLAPMFSTTGGPQILMGTPRGMNWFHDRYMAAAPDARFHWRTSDSPYVSKAWLEETRLSTPDRQWRQEYDAEFLTDGGEVFRGVDNAVGQPAEPDDFTVMGLDIARTHDWTFIYIFNSRAEWVYWQRVGHLDWSVQRLAVLQAYKRYKVGRILLDATGIQVGAEAVVYDLQREGCAVESVHITPEVKRALVETLMLRFDLGGIRIAAETAQEFKEFSVETLASGYDRYSAPQGKHDDAVMAAALAVWGLRSFQGNYPVKPQPSIVERELARLGWGPNGWQGPYANGEPEPRNGWEA